MRDEGDTSAIFRHIYDTEHWQGGSGAGSRSDATVAYRRVVERLISARDVRTVVDVGCGDWEFSQLIDWSSVTYVGLDVVPELIDRNRAKFQEPNVRFECEDVRKSLALPSADVLLCKDVLQHWPIGWIQDFLARTRPRYRYRLLTNDIASLHCPPGALNSPINPGEWRTLDLESAEFGQMAAWRRDYDLRGEWTKRILLLVAGWYRVQSSVRPGSALRMLRRL